MNSVDAYGAVNEHLENLNVVDKFAVTGVEGDQLSFSVICARWRRRALRGRCRVAGLVEEDRIDTQDFGPMGSGPPFN